MTRPPDDDEPEIEVAAMAEPLVRRPRVKNPAIDDVIHTGEIKPRSLIVRSTQPSLATLERPASGTDAPPPMPAPAPAPAAPRPRRGWLWLVAALVPLAALGASTQITPAAAPPPSPAGLEALADFIGTTIDGEAHAVQVRTEAVASSSMLRAGIETDPQTLADMAGAKDIVFPVGAREQLEVVQVRDGARVSMLRIPAAAPAATTAPPAPGTARLELRGDVPTLVADAAITTQTGAVGGDVVLAVPLDVARIAGRIPPGAATVALTGLAAPIALGGAPAPATPLPVTLPIHTSVSTAGPVTLTAALAAPAPARPPSWLVPARLVNVGLAALCVCLFVISLVRRRRG